jgi:hypothetical protein
MGLWNVFTGDHPEDRVAKGNPGNSPAHRRDGFMRLGAQWRECMDRNARDWRAMWSRR